MITKSDLLSSDWKLLRMEVFEHRDGLGSSTFDGYSRFWCKEAVLGAYWIVEQSDSSTVDIRLTDDVELEGFREELSFRPDSTFKRELLDYCAWEEPIRQVFRPDDARQLSLFEE